MDHHSSTEKKTSTALTLPTVPLEIAIFFSRAVHTSSTLAIFFFSHPPSLSSIKKLNFLFLHPVPHPSPVNVLLMESRTYLSWSLAQERLLELPVREDEYIPLVVKVWPCAH